MKKILYTTCVFAVVTVLADTSQTAVSGDESCQPKGPIKLVRVKGSIKDGKGKPVKNTVYQIAVPGRGDEALQATIERNPYKAGSIEELVAAWLPISFAANSLNRTMGQPDLYPFIISQPAIEKLSYIHQLIRNNSLNAA